MLCVVFLLVGVSSGGVGTQILLGLTRSGSTYHIIACATGLIQDFINLLKQNQPPQRAEPPQTQSSTLAPPKATGAAAEASTPQFTDPNTAELYRKSMAGDDAAMVDLGIAYGTAKDFVQAAFWYRKAAEAGNTAGMVSLGYIYQRGYGVELDSQQAVSWYRQAADKGDPRGMNALAWLYATSSDPAIRNPTAALEYALKAVGAEGANPNPHHLDTLAEAYFVNSRYQEAADTEQRAIALASEQDKVPFQKNLEKYQLALSESK